jgi:hypothetical protein
MDDLKKILALAALICALPMAAGLADPGLPDSSAAPDMPARPAAADFPEPVPAAVALVKQTAKPDDRSDKVPHRAPALALALSAVVPGGGQLYTQKFIRAAAFAGALGYFGYGYWREDRAMRRDVSAGNAALTDAEAIAYYDSYSRHYENRRTYQWWGIGIWLFSLADAYVDAHLFKFDERAAEPAISLQAAPAGIALSARF